MSLRSNMAFICGSIGQQDDRSGVCLYSVFGTSLCQ